MSEYMEKFTVSRLIGAPPGYVGYEEGGQPTEKVRRKPYSVILLDEIEKAHPDIYNILLQVLDDGQLTDGLGRKIDFKNTLIIMTSNIGARQLKDFGDGVGFATASRMAHSDENNKAVIEKALKRTFSPEFLNRIDDVIVFNSLTKENIFSIIDILMKGVLKRLNNLGFSLEITPEVKEFLSDKGYDSQFGARPLHRAIQKYLEDPLAEEILASNIKNGDTVMAALDKEAGKVVGYGIIRPCEKGYRIGPLYADTGEQAKNLTLKLLKTLTEQQEEVFFDAPAPSHNKFISAFVEYFGLQPSNSSNTELMFKGEPPAAMASVLEKTYATCSLELG